MSWVGVMSLNNISGNDFGRLQLGAPRTPSHQSPEMAQALNSPEPQQAQRLGSRFLPLQPLALVPVRLSTMR